MEEQTIARYSTATRFLHWATALVVLIAYAYGPGGPEVRVYAAARDAERQLHETLGLVVLALVVLRVLWRAFDTRPVQAPLARWMDISARSVQMALYLLLFAVPLTAVAGAWLEGHPLTLLGAVTLASPWAESHALGASIARVHAWLGDAVIWLAGMHALAGLFHHYVLKDGVLESMLPRRRARSQ